MQRRAFFKIGALTFSSLLGHAGCRDSGGGGGSGDSGTGGTGDTGATGDSGTDTGGREIIDAPERFPQSVASGDPRDSSVILWTRVEDPELPDADYEVEVEIWPLEGGGPSGGADDGGSGGAGQPLGGTTVMVTAEAMYDHCVKVKVEGLEPGTEFGYRFLYIVDGVGYASRIGQTKTAAPPEADVEVRFAFVSCQDYGGRYYNAYAALAEQDLDFFVHLGDYIYETVGDASFQLPGGEERDITFDDQEGALALGSGDDTYYAAASLDNYRQLYRTYRADPALQRVHERMAMVATWDDHEFTNDCWGTMATYSDGREDEMSPARRTAANQAWWEYMPVDYPTPDFVYDPSVPSPDDIRIYRDLEFGQHVHLVMTDLRSYRPDHLVPEDAYPGQVVMDEAALASVAPYPAAAGVPYVDIDTFAGGMYADLLRQAAMDGDYDPARVTGNISADYINSVNEAAGTPLPAISQMELDAMPRGLAFHQMFKNTFYGQIGSRYLLVRDPFLLYARWMHEQSGGAAQRIMGAEQQDWFLGVMGSSTRTWKVWGNEFCLTTLDVDLGGSALPPAFQQAFTMSAEDWNGFPDNRQEIIDTLADVENVVAITGDIHAFFAGTPFATPGVNEGNRLVEFVTGSITSSAYSSILVSQVEADPNLSQVPGIEFFALGIDALLTGGPNASMGFANTVNHGFAVITANGTEMLVDFHMHPEDIVSTERYDDASLASVFDVEHFRVEAGSRDLYRDINGAWARWDPTTLSWV